MQAGAEKRPPQQKPIVVPPSAANAQRLPPLHDGGRQKPPTQTSPEGQPPAPLQAVPDDATAGKQVAEPRSAVAQIAPGHAVPHAPQLAGSWVGSTQLPPQQRPIAPYSPNRQLVAPEAQAIGEQVPAPLQPMPAGQPAEVVGSQTAEPPSACAQKPPWQLPPAGQTLPQRPQFWASPWMSAHAVPQHEPMPPEGSGQSAPCVAAVHVGFALQLPLSQKLPAAQATPQAPQFWLSLLGFTQPVPQQIPALPPAPQADPLTPPSQEAGRHEVAKMLERQTSPAGQPPSVQPIAPPSGRAHPLPKPFGWQVDPAGQTLPQPPQFFGSEAKDTAGSTQAAPQHWPEPPSASVQKPLAGACAQLV